MFIQDLFISYYDYRPFKNSLLNKVSSLSDENIKLKIENEQGLNSLAEENRILNEENSPFF